MKHKEVAIQTQQIPIPIISIINLKILKQNRLSVEYTIIPTDVISCRSTSGGRTVVTFQVNFKQSRISEIVIQHMKDDSF